MSVRTIESAARHGKRLTSAPSSQAADNEGERKLRELVRTNDMVLVSAIGALLDGATIQRLLVEIDPELAELARGNAASNAIAADVITLDVTSAPGQYAAAGLAPDSVDIVLMNPPFNDPARHRLSPDMARATAHAATAATLEDWVRAARRVLKSQGTLTLIWRADGLAEVLTALDRGFGTLAILPVHGDATSPAIRVP